MKIGFIIGTLNFSGAEKIARYLIESLHKDYSHEIGLILLSSNTYPEFDYVKQFTVKTTGNVVSRLINRQKKIRQIVESEGFDVVVSFGVKYNLDVMEALRHSKIPVILCERNDPVSDPARKSLRIRRKLIYKKATGFVFQTERIADFFGEKIKSRSAVIPNFIEKKYEKVDHEAAENIIVITARLSEKQKNLSMLLRAFNRFSKDNDYKLYLVGDGPDEAMYRSYIKENSLEDKVVLTGKQKVMPYLKNAKFFVLSSYYEGMPNSLIEALAVGLPCISTDCSGGGAAALIKNGENGILIPSNDEDAMVDAMTKMANDPELRTRLANEAYKINETLEFNKIISMWIDYIESVAKGGKK
ncbi:MAG: glycosyltransferase family 4 protein [Ruminococcaceae bacterium]|nr:glycosyltransferase family 4 protein [Oscillospiraceae bacterium]